MLKNSDGCRECDDTVMEVTYLRLQGSSYIGHDNDAALNSH